MNRRIRNCYISAPAGSNLRMLRECLAEREIKVLLPEELELGSDWATEISRNIQQADLVIGVLSRLRRSQWVLFELGQAWAAGRQVVVFAPPGTADFAPVLRRFLVLRVKLDNREAIRFGLDQVLASPQATAAPSPIKKSEAPILAPNITKFLDDLELIRQEEDYTGLGMLLSDVLHSAGVKIFAERPIRETKEHEVDFAVWSDALQPFVGNPLLVDVKLKIGEKGKVEEVLRRFSRTIEEASGRWGLLIYVDGPASHLLPASRYPTVLAISFKELLERMRVKSFDEIVRDLRNQRVHGGSNQ